MKTLFIKTQSKDAGVVVKGRQFRAARELLGLTPDQLCNSCGISRPTLRDIENGTGDPRRSSLDVVGDYLKSCGIQFTNDVGVVGVSPQMPGETIEPWTPVDAMTGT